MTEPLPQLHMISGDQQALTAAQLEQVVQIICEAFAHKLAPYGVSCQATGAILREDLQPAYACYALQGDRVVGVLGQATRQGQCLHLRWRTLWRQLGPRKALLGGLVMCGKPTLAASELRIEPLAVAADCRNQGIGSQLLQKVIVSAPTQGIRLLTLDVVDSNLAAERLYRRHGFVRQRTWHTGWFTRRAGFGAVYRMQRRLERPYPSYFRPKEAS